MFRTSSMKGLLIPASVCAVIQILSASQAFAAGFEKGINWGAKEAGYAGIGSVDTGANSLWFNPAGLINTKAGHELSLNMSPTMISESGPVDFNNDSVSGSQITMPLGLLYDYTLNDKWAFAAGYYVAAGAKSDFNSTAMPGSVAGTASMVNEVTDIEFSLGAAYKLNDQWKLGASWRASTITASVASIAPVSALTTAAFSNLRITNLAGNNYSGFKLGAQYQPSEKTKFGLEYRTEIPLMLNGNFGGTLSTTTTTLPIDNSATTVFSVLPMQLVLGAEHDYEKWKALAQIDWTQYSRVGELFFNGVVTAGGGAVSLASGVHVPYRLQDQYILRLGTEYTGWSWPLRFGYAWTNQVSDSSSTIAAGFPPAMMHSLAVGTGKTLSVMDRPLDFNFAVDYSYSSGSANGAAAGVAFDQNLNGNRAGTITLTTLTAHFSVAYSF